MCPFTHQIIDLTNETDKVFPITTHFYDNDLVKGDCEWFFLIGNDQQLKVVVMKVIPTKDFTLTLSADGNQLKEYDLLLKQT